VTAVALTVLDVTVHALVTYCPVPGGVHDVHELAALPDENVDPEVHALQDDEPELPLVE
jgi:hypothetical protein